MGCGSSKGGLQHVDDSVHVMLKHDRKSLQKKEGSKAQVGYKERAAHPMLKPKAVNSPTDGDGPAAASNTGGPVAVEED